MLVNTLFYGIQPSNTIHQVNWRPIFWYEINLWLFFLSLLIMSLFISKAILWFIEYSLFVSPLNAIQQFIWRAIHVFLFKEYSLSILPSNTIHKSIWRAIQVSWLMEYSLFVSPFNTISSLYGGQYPAEWNNHQDNSLSHSPAHCKFWLQGKVRSSVKPCYGSTGEGSSGQWWEETHHYDHNRHPSTYLVLSKPTKGDSCSYEVH